MTTPGIQFLERKKISHQVIKDHHESKGAEFAAHATSFPLK